MVNLNMCYLSFVRLLTSTSTVTNQSVLDGHRTFEFAFFQLSYIKIYLGVLFVVTR